jgi:hypothetical protein
MLLGSAASLAIASEFYVGVPLETGDGVGEFAESHTAPRSTEAWKRGQRTRGENDGTLEFFHPSKDG